MRSNVPSINVPDVVCRDAARSKVEKIGTLHYSDDYDVEIITLFDGRVTFGNNWGRGEIDVDVLIDAAEYVDELPFVQLQHVVEDKSQRASTKYLLHIESLKQRKSFGLAAKTD